MFIKVLLFVILGVVLLSLIVLLIILLKLRHTKNVIIDKLTDIASSLGEKEPQIRFSSKSVYDLSLNIKGKTYYMKFIRNTFQKEIVINNPHMWQIINNPANPNEKMRFVKGVEEFMNSSIDSSKKNVVKAFVIYPGTRCLMQYINESEMRFVYKDTLIEGCNVIPFDKIEELF